MFVIQNSLLNFVRYNIYKLMSSTISRKDNTYTFILPSMAYLAILENKFNYVIMNEPENYKHLVNNEILCKCQNLYYSM